MDDARLADVTRRRRARSDGIRLGARCSVLGANADEMFALLEPWARAVITPGPRPWEL